VNKMEEVQALESLTQALRDLELLQSFERDCGKALYNECPTLNFSKSSGHSGYRLASRAMGDLLSGEIPRLLKEAIEVRKVVVEKCRKILRDAKS